MPPEKVTFTDLATATYCPRQLYYDRRADDREPPPEAVARVGLAFRYPELRRLGDDALATEPIGRPPDEFRAALDRLADRPDWAALFDPPRTHVLLDGKDARGIVHKLLGATADGDADAATTGNADTTAASDAAASSNADATAATGAAVADSPLGAVDDAGPARTPPVPVLVSPGDPPEHGVWEPQSVRAVAAMNACSWETGRRVRRALVEYPTHGVVREVRLSVRRAGTYRRVLRAVRDMEGTPSRLSGDAKCDSCRHRTNCGVNTRSLRSLIGL